MYIELINRSPDLTRLLNEGYEIDVSNGFLLINHVPYVNANKQVVYGTLVSRLTISDNTTLRPNDHIALWVGEYPCDYNGSQLTNLVINTNPEQIREGLMTTHTFSQKPQEGYYEDYYQKMTQYVHMLDGHAHAIQPEATATTFQVIKLTPEESVFCYIDSASSRAGITFINEKLKKARIAIVGLGGTGSYVLDLVCKTSVEEIHLFDGDMFLQHNAFRSPGAPSSDDLAKRPTKVGWFSESYSRMRRKIIPHYQFVDATNVTELRPVDFVFLCLDKGGPKRVIMTYLIENNIPFIDVGMGLSNVDNALTGSVRLTTFTPSYHDHMIDNISFNDEEDNVYSTNIQIADLNALNAALAVVKWKKMLGIYHDFTKEHHAVYQVSTNVISNEEVRDET